MRTFSLILPVYRVAADLPACLDSIAVQRESWEAICIDDGSPDTCGESIDHAVRRDARFRAHRTPGKPFMADSIGIVTCRSTASAQTSGL